MICVFFVFCSMVVQGNVPLQYGQVSQFDGNVYLAHNYFDGQYFFEIEPGMMVRYGDKSGWHDFKVTEVIEAPAEEPTSLTTRLLIGGEWRSPHWVHVNVYDRPDTIVLQTCIQKGDEIAWGRLLVIAERWNE